MYRRQLNARADLPQTYAFTTTINVCGVNSTMADTVRKVCFKSDFLVYKISRFTYIFNYYLKNLKKNEIHTVTNFTKASDEILLSFKFLHIW